MPTAFVVRERVPSFRFEFLALVVVAGVWHLFTHLTDDARSP